MKGKHGLNQYRLNHAKGYAQNFLEMVSKIEIMFQMSDQGLVEDGVAERYISNNINELDRNWEYFKGYIEQREDMR
ncbi:hypothetical protein [Paenibacillus sp. 1781tsa1]|uniref:hypothetical protein n=1 Tax=Paenibacillus sp. 1781tsa1 TaxID=2953810 RepID=UPI00209D0CE6|nr:hypothetical protein [Paenibacillus sp. 1781tsa1]MCP1184987.1 hypothetical protein [Paenibacillus sp. 1781tsa1]